MSCKYKLLKLLFLARKHEKSTILGLKYKLAENSLSESNFSNYQKIIACGKVVMILKEPKLILSESRSAENVLFKKMF